MHSTRCPDPAQRTREQEVMPELGSGLLGNGLVEVGTKYPRAKVQPSRDLEARRTWENLRS